MKKRYIQIIMFFGILLFIIVSYNYYNNYRMMKYYNDFEDKYLMISGEICNQYTQYGIDGIDVTVSKKSTKELEKILVSFKKEFENKSDKLVISSLGIYMNMKTKYERLNKILDLLEKRGQLTKVEKSTLEVSLRYLQDNFQ